MIWVDSCHQTHVFIGSSNRILQWYLLLTTRTKSLESMLHTSHAHTCAHTKQTRTDSSNSCKPRTLYDPPPPSSLLRQPCTHYYSPPSFFSALATLHSFILLPILLCCGILATATPLGIRGRGSRSRCICNLCLSQHFCKAICLHVQLAMPFLAIENLYVLDMYNLLWVDGQAHQPCRALPCSDLFR